MTVVSKQDTIIQNYVRKLQEIKSFLQKTQSAEYSTETRRPIRINTYWDENDGYSY